MDFCLNISAFSDFPLLSMDYGILKALLKNYAKMTNDDEAEILAKAMEVADSLHGYLVDFHPLRSDLLDRRIAVLREEDRKIKFARLRDFLSQYEIDNTETRKAKLWSGQTHIFSQLARQYVEEQGKAPPKLDILLGYFLDRIDGNLRVAFNAKAKPNELSYETILNRLSKKYDSKGARLPAHARTLHDFNYGDRTELNEWLQSADSRDFKISLPAKIKHYEDNHQVLALAHIAKIGRDSFMAFLPEQIKKELESKAAYSEEQKKASHLLGLPRDFVIGIEEISEDSRVIDKFKIETFKKIRSFLAYEFENVRELNRSAALMALTFPNYNDFTKYVLNKGSYNPETQSLDLSKIIDTSHLYFIDNDYQAWGELLLDQGPSQLFYAKVAHLLDNIPRNEKGKILIGQLDRQLYNQVAELVGFCTEGDCERYSELKIVRDVLSIIRIKEEYRKDTEFMKDEMTGLRDINIDGSRFGKPGWRFGRLSYNDDRFFVVGRFTKSCEYIDGHWGNTVKEGYKNRSSTFYCLFDENNRILAHSWTYRSADTFDILFDGFEADQNEVQVTEDLLKKIIEEIKKDRPNQKFDIGTSASQFSGIESVKTIIPGEERPDAVKVIDESKIFDVYRIVEQAEIASTFVYNGEGINKPEDVVVNPPKPPEP